MQDKREVYSTPNRMQCTTELGYGMSLSLPCIRLWLAAATNQDYHITN